MGPGAWMMLIVILISLGTLAVLIASTARSIQNNRTAHRTVWREFGLGLLLMVLFFTTWIAHAIAEWQVFTDEQREHGQSPALGDFVATFAQSTLENWQSEFLQLATFTIATAYLVYKGSSESSDSEERMEAKLDALLEERGIEPDDVEQSVEPKYRKTR